MLRTSQDMLRPARRSCLYHDMPVLREVDHSKTDQIVSRAGLSEPRESGGAAEGSHNHPETMKQSPVDILDLSSWTFIYTQPGSSITPTVCNCVKTTCANILY